LPTVLEILGLGVMEYWSVEKKGINFFVITPILQYSNTLKLIEIESYHDGLPSFGYRSVFARKKSCKSILSGIKG
jgi:hypothetical protein